jgi:hypothetical protein
MPLRVEVQELIEGHPFVRMLEHSSRALRVLRKEILREEIQTVRFHRETMVYQEVHCEG